MSFIYISYSVYNHHNNEVETRRSSRPHLVAGDNIKELMKNDEGKAIKFK